MASAAAAMEPPRSSMAFDLCMRALNHSSANNATMVQGNAATLSTMVEYKDRLEHAMKAASVSTQELADHLKVSYQAVKKVLDGKTSSFTAQNNAKAADFLGVNASWLATGVGQWIKTDEEDDDLPMFSRSQGAAKGLESNVSAAPALASSIWLPVVGHVRAGPDGYLEEMQYPVGHGEGYVEYWTKDPAAYALRIKGDSMHPRYRAGEYIVVTPSIEPQPGRDVVVKLRTGQSMLKQLNWIRGGELQLMSINNGYAPHTISLEEVESIQRVGGSVPPDAFTNERPLP